MSRSRSSLAESLGRAHRALLADLRKLDEATRAPSETGSANLKTRLEATQRHVAEHFRLEEHDGYMDAVRKREPRLERTILELLEEHRQLAQSLEALISRAGPEQIVDEPFRHDIRAWTARLRRHEAREDGLVQEVYGLDIGTED